MTAEEKVIDELLAELDRQYPDPVDLYEDELAKQLGLRRHTLLAQESWRRARVAFIDAHPDADRVADQMWDDEDKTTQDWRPQW